MTRDTTEPSRLAELLRDGSAEGQTPAAAVVRERTFLCARVGARLYALPSEHVVEVISPSAMTPVPHTPDYILGVLSSHSRVTPIFDLARYVGEHRELRIGRIVVLRAGTLLAGIPVEKIVGIRTYAESAIAAPLPEMRDLGAFVVGHVLEPDAVFLVLDVGLLLSQARTRRNNG